MKVKEKLTRAEREAVDQVGELSQRIVRVAGTIAKDGRYSGDQLCAAMATALASFAVDGGQTGTVRRVNEIGSLYHTAARRLLETRDERLGANGHG